MRLCSTMTCARLGAVGVALAVGLSGAPAFLTGPASAATASPGRVVSAPSAGPVGPEACIIGLNCGCIRYRTCPGHRRPPARTPEPQMDGKAPAVTRDQGAAPAAVTRTLVWASLSV